jgi:hypothetical protein
MAGDPIEKGTPQAWLVMDMIDAYLRDDFPRLETLLNRVGGDYGDVFRLFIVVLGGTIQAIANRANQTFDEILPGLLAQMAARTDAIAAADVARRALTAWFTGDDELVTRLGFDEDIESAGPDLVLLHFLGMLMMISRSWADQVGLSMVEIRAQWATDIGTTDAVD